MKILSSLPAAPEWLKVEPLKPRLVSSLGNNQKLDQGNPLSVLPDSVQESLRAGRAVDPREIVRVPTR